MRITFDSNGVGTIPGHTTSRKTVVRNTGGVDLFWGFEQGTTASTGDSQGVLFAGANGGDVLVLDYERGHPPIYFKTASTGAINYTEQA
jgi:hypothetical protein